MALDSIRLAQIVRESALENIMPYFGRGKLGPEDIIMKRSGKRTIADLKNERALQLRLTDLLPGSIFVGEEAHDDNERTVRALLAEQGYVWIVDPLDGTNTFIRGEKGFAVMVALAKDQEVVMGLIYNPATDEMIIAEEGAGAYFQAQKLKVLAPPDRLEDMRGFMSRQLLEKGYGPRYDPDLTDDKVQLCWTANHDYVRLVLGGDHFGADEPQAHFRAIPRFSNPWDDAAGVFIHKMAGGYAAHWEGEPFSIRSFEMGMLLTPNDESWHETRGWCGRLLPDVNSIVRTEMLKFKNG